jgi:hypothetical protein
MYKRIQAYNKINHNKIDNKIDNNIYNKIDKINYIINKINNKIDNKINNIIDNKIDNKIDNIIDNKIDNIIVNNYTYITKNFCKSYTLTEPKNIIIECLLDIIYVISSKLNIGQEFKIINKTEKTINIFSDIKMFNQFITGINGSLNCVLKENQTINFVYLHTSNKKTFFNCFVC